MTQGRRSGRRRQRGKPVQLICFIWAKSESVALRKKTLTSGHLLMHVREGSFHHYSPDVAAIMDCCLARGPLMKESFSSCAPLRETQPRLGRRVWRS